MSELETISVTICISLLAIAFLRHLFDRHVTAYEVLLAFGFATMAVWLVLGALTEENLRTITIVHFLELVFSLAFWLYARKLFDDDFRVRSLDLAPAVGYAIVFLSTILAQSLEYQFIVESGDPILSATRVFLFAHLSYVALSKIKIDLIDARIFLRIAYTVGFMIVLVVSLVLAHPIEWNFGISPMIVRNFLISFFLFVWILSVTRVELRAV